MPIWPRRGGDKGEDKDVMKHQPPVLELANGRSVALRPGMEIKIARPMADICIVFDTTASMSGKIEGLITCMTDFAADLARLSLDWRLSVVPFGDLTVPGDRIDAGLPFTDSVTAAVSQLRAMPRFAGGGNNGESSVEALLSAIAKPWRTKAVRVILLLTDEPALGSDRAGEVLRGLTAAEVICFTASPDHPYFRSWAAKTGGRWAEISQTMDTSAVLDLLRGLVRDVAKAASDMHAIAGGSYRRYLEITAGQ